MKFGPISLLLTSLVAAIPMVIGSITPMAYAQTTYNNAQSSPISVTEVNYAGSYSDSCGSCAFDKWVELFNASSYPISLDGYSLRFKESTDQNMNLDLSGYSIGARSYFLIANKRSGMESMLPASIAPDIISGKVLSVSNNQTKTIQVSVIFNGEVIEFNSIQTSQLLALESQSIGLKHSVEKVNGIWRLASDSYALNNYGSPKGYILPSIIRDQPAPAPSSEPQPVTNQPHKPVTAPISTPQISSAGVAVIGKSTEVVLPIQNQQLMNSKTIENPTTLLHDSLPPISQREPLYERFAIPLALDTSIHLNDSTIFSSRRAYRVNGLGINTQKIYGIRYSDQLLLLMLTALYVGSKSENTRRSADISQRAYFRIVSHIKTQSSILTIKPARATL